MEKLNKTYKYRCIKRCTHRGGNVWEIGDFVNSANWQMHEQKECFEAIELTIKERFDDFRKGMNLTYLEEIV